MCLKGGSGTFESIGQLQDKRGAPARHLHGPHTDSRVDSQASQVQGDDREEAGERRHGRVLADAEQRRRSILARHHAAHSGLAAQPHRDRPNSVAQRRSHHQAARLQLQVHRVSQSIQVRLAEACAVAFERLPRPCQWVLHFLGQHRSHLDFVRTRPRAQNLVQPREILSSKLSIYNKNKHF